MRPRFLTMTMTLEGNSHWRLLLQAVCFITSLPAVSADCTFQVTSDGKHAQCSNRRLTRLPVTWPGHVTFLDASINNLTDLHGLDVPQLAGLRHLNLSHNSINIVPNDSFECLSQLQELDLSDNDLLPLPEHAFRGPLHLTSLTLRHMGPHQQSDTLLDLTCNSLTTAARRVSGLEILMLAGNGLTEIVNYSFVGLAELIKLDLSHNQLTLLQTAAFSGLANLRELDLSYNRLVMNTDAYPAGVFSPLVSLHTLALYGNDDRTVGTYNMPALTSLSSLRSLSIDTFADAHFGQDFAGLTNLTTLNLDNSRMLYLRNTTFQSFKNSFLEELIIIFSGVDLLEPCVFCDLPRLKRLTCIGLRISLDSTLRLLYGLQNQSMSLLDLSHNKMMYISGISATNMQYLQTMCIHTFIVSKCALSFIISADFKVESAFCECLRRIDISGNRMNKLPLFKWSACFKNVEWFDCHNQQLFSRWPARHQFSGKVNHSDMIVSIPTPLNLSFVNMSGTSGSFGPLIPQVHFPNGRNLITLDLSYIGARQCEVKVTGLTSLQTLIFSGNDCNTLDDDMFRHTTNIRHLALADLKMDQDFLMRHATQLLSPLELLEHLDLSKNNLHLLPPDMLRAQSRLQSLLLASNRFESIPEALDKQTSLSLLDLSDNNIGTLLTHERRLLDTLAQNHTVHVRLRNNPLSCRCATLDFVLWLSRTDVRLDGRVHITGYDDDYDDNGRDYPCVLQDGSMSTTWAVMAEWQGHWRRCVGQTAFWAALVGLLLQLLGLLLTFVVSRNWTYVCYAWRVLRHLPLPQRLSFRKDVVLVHADRDLELAVKVTNILRVRQRVRVLLPYEEIMPGDLWAETSLKLLDNSWKILLVVTKNLLHDPQAGVLVHDAKCSITDTMPDRVLVLFLEQPAQLLAPGQQQPDPLRASLQSLLRVVPDRNVFHVHKDAESHHPVWDRLAQLILHQ